MKYRPKYRFHSIVDAVCGPWVRRIARAGGDANLRAEIRTVATEPWIPRVRTLEPRIVLNATAELTGMGELLIAGDAADNALDVSLNLSGELQITEASVVVPIRVGTDPLGNPITVNSLDPSQITSGQLTANLGAGNDSLRVDVPVGLNVTAVGGAGRDLLDISLNADGSGVSDNTLNLVAETIHLDGGGDDIDLTTSTLQAGGSSGLITIDDVGSLRLGEINVAGGSLQIGDGSSLSGALSQAGSTKISADLVSVDAANDVELFHTNNSIGDLSVYLGSGMPGSTLHLVAGAIHIDGGGDDIDLTSSTLRSDGGTGLITIEDASSLVLGNINVADGSLQIGGIGSSLGGAISQAGGTSISADLMSVDAASDVRLSNAGNSIGDLTVFLEADALGVSDGTLNLVAGAIHIDGGGDDIDLTSSTLRSDGGTGLITIEDASSLVLGNISVADGSLQIGSVGSSLGGAISQAAGTGISAERLSVHAASDVELSNDENSIVTVDRIQSGGDVDLNSDLSSRPGGTMTIHRIETVSGSMRGDINVNVTGSVDLISSGDNDNVLTTENGEINVIVSDDIHIMDFVAANDGSDTAANHEIIAGGNNGRVSMSAGDEWIAGSSVQIYASQTTDGAVRIDAREVMIGNDFEINTGDGVGVARRLAPRPELTVVPPAGVQPVYPGVITDPSNPNYVKIETAFYDVQSIKTDILTQANQNDASGMLSIDMGAAGENGLTLSIDWGGQSNRFQRIEDLPGDHTQVNVSHVYLESDILNSTLNGRGSATDPLAVRFAVSHHDSIVVMGDSIVQSVPANQIPTAGGPTLQNTVPGRLLTSTDDPQTTSLESGRAFFVIPRVNVPLAFLPVRDVLPDPVEPTPPVVLVSSIQLQSVIVDAEETSPSPPSIRDEYFQLRTLSPDPNGEDLIDPIRLPDSILAEDRLDELFAELPDGAYEIDYVIGNSDERMILRVDLRGGKAILTENEIDGAPLELEVLDLAEQIENLETVPANE